MSSHLEHWFAAVILDGLGAHLPPPEREYRFNPSRRWRFDFAWPAQRVAVELEGGGHVYGRHHRPAGYAADCEKYNQATLLGWRVLRYTEAMVRDDPARIVWEVGQLLEALNANPTEDEGL